MTKKIPIGFMIAIIVLAVAITFGAAYNIALNNFNKKILELNERQEMYSKLSSVDQEVRSAYYTDINNSGVINGAVQGYVQGLGDPQSKYLSKEEYETETNNQSKVDADDVKASRVAEDIGYIRISNFTTGTDARFKTELTNLQNSEVRGIVIDLRNNVGENVQTAAMSANALVGLGETLSVQYKDGHKEVLFNSDAEHTGIPISLIVNEKTSLGAEVFTGIIKDSGRAKVVGTKTAGIGTKTEICPLSDGSAVKLSVANYITKGGEAFTGKGIVPNTESTPSDEQKKSYDTGSLLPNDDTMLQEAIAQLAT